MPSITMCFSGYLTADITTAMVVATGKDVDVSDWPASTLITKLQRGEVAISLAKALEDSAPSEVELFDFAAAD